MASVLAKPQALEDQFVRDMYVEAHDSFSAFAAALTRWRLPYHQGRICRALERVERTPGARLIITMPPRHGKSELGSIAFPLFCLGRGFDTLAAYNDPERVHRVAIAAYGADLAIKFSAAIRDHIADQFDPVHDVFGSLRLSKKSDREWRLFPAPANRPSCIGVGVGGPFTGKGADLLIIDDPVKNYEDVRSSRKRDSVYDWYATVARTRMQKGGRIVLIMTRWHEDDLAGRLLAQGGWEHLHLRAIDGAGQALWPDTYPIEELLKIRAEIGSKNFQALYQGEPTFAEGNIWKRAWFDANAYDQPEDVPPLRWVVTAWDTAFKTGQQDDYTAWCTVGADKRGELWCLDMGHERLAFPDLVQAIESGHGRPTGETALVEDKASGQSAVQTITRNGRRPVVAVKADTDKESRAQAVTPFCEAGKLHLPRRHCDYEALVAECTSFPNGAHDDMMDALVHALRYGIDRLNAVQEVIFV